MIHEVISLEETVDLAINKALRVLAILSFPALMIACYRNLYVDFLPIHQLTITFIWIHFLTFSINLKPFKGHRLNALAAVIFLLFVATSIGNESIVVAATFFLLLVGLISLLHSIKSTAMMINQL